MLLCSECLRPFSALKAHVLRYYLATSRELKRLDAVSKSPIFAWFSETLSGVSTIRGFGQQKVFMLGNEGRIDRNQMCYLPSISCNRWLAIRLEFIGAIIIFCTSVFSLWALFTTGVDAGLVGLVLSYSLNVTGSLVSRFDPLRTLTNRIRIGLYVPALRLRQTSLALNVFCTMSSLNPRPTMRSLVTKRLPHGPQREKWNSGACEL